jgi:uncharacterized protein YkwD
MCVAWVDPKDGALAVGYPSSEGLMVYQRSGSGPWQLSNLTAEVNARQGLVATPIVRGLAVLTSPASGIAEADRSLVSLIGYNASHQLVRYAQFREGGSLRWAFNNLSTDRFDPQGEETPQWTDRALGYVTPWNGQNVAGLDANREVTAVWTAPALNGVWHATNLSRGYGTPPLAGGPFPYVNWGINLAGVLPSGELGVTWWSAQLEAERRAAGRTDYWAFTNLTEQTGGPLLRPESVTATTAPNWPGNNVYGISEEGRLVAYWWTPDQRATHGREWLVADIGSGIADAEQPVGKLTALALKDDSFVILGVSATGDVLRFYWEPSYGGQWRFENLTRAVTASSATPYARLSALRQAAGMIGLPRNERLESAATNHAQFLNVNNFTGHGEVAGLPGFTGVSPAARVHAVGYRSKFLLENVSSGQESVAASIDDLMTAIYHRLGFLDFRIDQIGVGAVTSGLASYVFNMGNSGLESACNGPDFSGFGSFYLSVCEPNIRVETGVYNAALTAPMAANPALVVWPPDGAADVPPAFFTETPDPLPDYEVSGNPLSVQFNEHFVTTAAVQSFRLFRQADGLEVSATRRMDEGSDPNGQLTAHQFVLFPLDRLAWNTEYRAELHYTRDGIPGSLSWRFRTRDPGVPTYTVTSGDSLRVTAGSPFVAYIPPTALYPSLGGVQWTTPPGVSVDVNFEDSNTLRITVTGAGLVTFRFNGNTSSFAVVSHVLQ